MVHDGSYFLYDLVVEVESSGDGRPMVCRHAVGDRFTLADDDLITFPAGMSFPIYCRRKFASSIPTTGWQPTAPLHAQIPTAEA